MEVGKAYKIVYQADKRAKCIFARVKQLFPEKYPQFVEIEALQDNAVFIIRLNRIIEMKELSEVRQWQ